MYDSPNYPTDPKRVDDFVEEQEWGTLIATAPGGYPQATILPFAKFGDVIELHCVQEDPTFAVVSLNPKVTFFISDVLAFTPHDWVDPDNAARATLQFRAVAYQGDAEVSTDPQVVAATLWRLLERLEPDGQYRPVIDDDFYGSRLRRLAAVHIRITTYKAKFKLGPYGPETLKRDVAQRLKARGRPTDGRAADVIVAALGGIARGDGDAR